MKLDDDAPLTALWLVLAGLIFVAGSAPLIWWSFAQ